MKIVVTGANGLVGTAVAKVCGDAGDTVVALTHKELDITDFTAVRSIVETQRPDGIINCAAYTDVDGAESAPEICYAVNETGVGNLASAARQARCRFLTISTDFVFDGEKEGFYTEEDTPNPQCVYGKAKLAGEQTAIAKFAQSIVVRTGWVFGQGGTNFLSVLPKMIVEGKDISAIGDSYGTPTFSVDLASRLRELVVLNNPGLYHVANKGGGTSYHGFALMVAELGGYEMAGIRETAAASLQRPASRPRNSRLSSVMLEPCGLSDLPDWKDAIQRHLADFKYSESTNDQPA